MPSLKSALKWTTIAALLAVTVACVPETEFDDRHLKPIPGKTLSLMSKKDMSPSAPILMRIFKKEAELEIWKQNREGEYALLKTFPMCRWSGDLGPKKKQGDRQAPEGVYWVNQGLMNPNSSFYLSFNLGYPNKLERALGYTGDFLMVHGACSSRGCYAMTDEGVQEIYSIAREAFAGGQQAFQVQALPFRMTARNMAIHREHEHMPFWQDLKVAYDIFEATRRVPTVNYCGGRYQFDVRAKDGVKMHPTQACPVLERNLDPKLLAYKVEQQQEYKRYIDEGMPALAVSFQDGGMHPSFQAMMKRLGPLEMSKRTSISEVPISRPEVAYANPYAALSGI